MKHKIEFEGTTVLTLDMTYNSREFRYLIGANGLAGKKTILNEYNITLFFVCVGHERQGEQMVGVYKALDDKDVILNGHRFERLSSKFNINKYKNRDNEMVIFAS